MQRDLWKRFNQLLMVPIVGIGVLYVALDPATPDVNTEVESSTADAAPIGAGISAPRALHPTTVPPPVAPTVTTPATSVSAAPAATIVSPRTVAPVAVAPTTIAPTTTAPTATSSTTPTTTTSTTVLAPPDAVTTAPTTTTVPTVDPECVLQLPLPIGDGWLCVLPGSGGLIG